MILINPTRENVSQGPTQETSSLEDRNATTTCRRGSSFAGVGTSLEPQQPHYRKGTPVGVGYFIREPRTKKASNKRAIEGPQKFEQDHKGIRSVIFPTPMETRNPKPFREPRTPSPPKKTKP